jgi:hypothetical protein
MAFVCGRHQAFVTDDGAMFLLHVLLEHLNGLAFEHELMQEVRSAMYAAPEASGPILVPAP